MGLGGEAETGELEFSPATEPKKIERTRSLSERIWNFSWEDHLPVALGSGGVQMEISSFDEISDFAREHFAELFELEKDNPFLHSEGGSSKERFYRDTADVFTYKRDGKIIGINVCGPSDWSSYYIRHSSLLPEAQGSLVISSMVRFLIERMQALGVKRIQAETSPANMPVLQTLLRLRFNPSGLQISERWGAMVLMTKLLDKQNEEVFLEQFCFGIHPQSESH